MRTEEPRAVNLKDYRAPDYHIASIELDFVLEPAATRVTAISKVTRTGDAVPLVLDGEALKLISVAIDGRKLDDSAYTLGADKLTIHAPPAAFMLEIVTEIAPDKNTELSGLYTATGIFCTQCEAEGFRRITYYLDRPDNLAVFTTRIEADRERYPVLLSNGNLVSEADLPGGRHFATWNDPFPKPSYLFALVAGDLGVLRDEFATMSGRKVALAIYVEHGNEAKVAYAMDSLKRAMRWDEEKYGCEYDLDIFMIVAVSAFNFGAMENKGLNIFNDKLLLASPETATDDDYARIESVVAHEYFHNWTGDRITCRDWFQLSLKEGVCRIGDVKVLRMRQFVEDAGPLAHPVQPQSYIAIDNFYTATVYEKGAEVIRMLQSLVGPDGYRKATDLYLKRHDGQAATVEDWVKCFEDACGRDLKQFRLWYQQSGTPTLEANGQYDPEKKSYALTLKQSLGPTPSQPTKKPMVVPVRLGLLGNKGALPLTLEGENATGPDERVLELNAPEQTFTFVNVEEEPLLSLGRRFSAPVHFKVPVNRRSLATLMARDTDAFNRWEAGQTLASDVLGDMIGAATAGGRPAADPTYVEAVGQALARADEDHAFAAQMLMPPSENELALASSRPDPDAIHVARTELIRTLAAVHGRAFDTLYRKLGGAAAFSPDAKSAGRRALRNACLRYLTASDDQEAAALADAHYRNAGNMTDMIAGLAALTRTDSPERTSAFAHFHDRFRADPLVLDKWLSLQASSSLPGTVDIVRSLMSRPPFDIRNPNRVRSLVGAFSANHLRFHATNGSGYKLLAEVIARLDPINPMVAARMAGAFESWRRYDEGRQALVRAQLDGLAKLDGLSSNLFEMVTKMLG
jgi:aminopeptidase N